VYGALYLQLAALPLHTCVCSAANELAVDEDLRESVALCHTCQRSTVLVALIVLSVLERVDVDGFVRHVDSVKKGEDCPAELAKLIGTSRV
jgi:hypothetical protein